MNHIRLYHSISVLLYLFLVFTILLLGRNIILTITDTFVFIGFVIFSIFGMYLVTFMNIEARSMLNEKTTKWMFVWHKRFIVVISGILHFVTFIGHLLSNQMTTQQYLPHTLFIIQLGVLFLVFIKEMYFESRFNQLLIEVVLNSTSYLLFAMTLYFVISPF